MPPFLYEPPKRALRAVGDVLGRMPLPGDPRAGPMHRVPNLQWQTWVRLAFVEAGSDWRSLNRLRVEDGHLADFALMPETHWHSGVLGVRPWDEPMGTVTGNARAVTGAYSVADPRYAATGEYGQLGVQGWSETSNTIRHVKSPIQGRFSVADPCHAGPPKFGNVYRVAPWSRAASAVTSSRDVAVADPRTFWPDGTHASKLRVNSYDTPTRTVTGSDRVGSGALCIADPRTPERQEASLGLDRDDNAGTIERQELPGNGAVAVADPRAGLTREAGDAYLTAGHYGVVPWSQSSGAVASAGQHDNGRWSVADPRTPAATDRLVAVIRSMDGTWHRPFTTYELAGLQSLVEPEEQLELDGLSGAAWRERIGNAVPPDAAAAIASTMGRTLLLAWSGQSFMLSSVPIWVRDVAVALTVDQPTHGDQGSPDLMAARGAQP